MEITIKGSLAMGPSWQALQDVIRSMTDQDGVVTRIARRGPGSNYRATQGTYDLTFVPDSGDAVDIVVYVNEGENRS